MRLFPACRSGKTLFGLKDGLNEPKKIIYQMSRWVQRWMAFPNVGIDRQKLPIRLLKLFHHLFDK